MLRSLFARCIGLSTLICVVLLFFFPLAQGNFQSTHGPVTALRSKRSIMVLVFSIVKAALLIFGVLIPRQIFEAARGLRASDDASAPFNFPVSASILRC